jgi:hypothetical protein
MMHRKLSIDMPTPYKDRLPDYKTCEHNLMLVIAEKFGFTYPLNDALKVIDSELEIEWENLVITDNPNFNVMDRVEKKTVYRFFIAQRMALW